jgi:starvation-inducible outer membrane lipoprotein
MKTTMTVLIASSALLLGGCVFAPSGGDDFPREARTTTVQPTLGQELIDLDRARAAGAISQSEFEQARASILDGRH